MAVLVACSRIGQPRRAATSRNCSLFTQRGVPFRGDRHGGRGVTGTGILSEGSSGINAASADQSSITTPSEGSRPIGSLIPSTPGPSTSSMNSTSDSSLSEFATPMAATPMKTRRAFHNDSVGKALTKPPLAQRLVDQVPHFCLVQDRHWKFCPDATRAAARWMQQLWAQQTNPSANVDGLDQKCPTDSNASIVW